MLKVKTKLMPSPIAGLGVFADEFIPKGTLVFKEDNLSIKIREEELTNYSEQELEYVYTYGYLRDGVWYCSMDNDKFTNHSDNSNLVDIGDSTYASRDIQAGEELFADYREIGCPLPWIKN